MVVKNVLVTASNGFIGRHVCKRLKELGSKLLLLLLIEKICQDYSQHFGINIVTLHPFFVYGPNSRDRSLISFIISQIKKDG